MPDNCRESKQQESKQFNFVKNGVFKKKFSEINAIIKRKKYRARVPQDQIINTRQKSTPETIFILN